eukprot:g21150.t1
MGIAVSSFNSVDKRTAPVPEDQLREVYDALTPALPQIFSSGAISVQMIMNVYRKENLFCAFALARVAAAMRVDHLERALGLFDLAKKKVQEPPRDPMTMASYLPEKAVLSYIHRNEVGKYNEAVECNRRAIALDPDFKLPYQGLANCQLLRGDLEAAMQACIYQKLLEPTSKYFDTQTRKLLAEKGRRALDLARRRLPEQWNENDQVMLDCLSAAESEREKFPRIELHIWKLHGFRP